MTHWEIRHCCHLGASNHTLGYFSALLKCDHNETHQDIYVVKRLHQQLLGRPAIEVLGLVRTGVFTTQLKWPMKDFPRLFKGLGSLNFALAPSHVWHWGGPTARGHRQHQVTVLALFRETILSADASSYGINGECKPVAYKSRAEIRLWPACESLSDYLLGLHFHIETDHWFRCLAQRNASTNSPSGSNISSSG